MSLNQPIDPSVAVLAMLIAILGCWLGGCL